MMRLSPMQMAIGAVAIWFFFIRGKNPRSMMVDGGSSDGYLSVVNGEGYP